MGRQAWRKTQARLSAGTMMNGPGGAGARRGVILASTSGSRLLHVYPIHGPFRPTLGRFSRALYHFMVTSTAAMPSARRLQRLRRLLLARDPVCQCTKCNQPETEAAPCSTIFKVFASPTIR